MYLQASLGISNREIQWKILFIANVTVLLANVTLILPGSVYIVETNRPIGYKNTKIPNSDTKEETTKFGLADRD